MPKGTHLSPDQIREKLKSAININSSMSSKDKEHAMDIIDDDKASFGHGGQHSTYIAANKSGECLIWTKSEKSGDNKPVIFFSSMSDLMGMQSAIQQIAG